jgi:membrane-associated protein
MLETYSLIQHFPYLGFFILLILGTLGLPFPEDGILLLGGFLTSHSVVEPLPAFLVIYSGLLVTDLFLYSVGRKYGRMLVGHKRFSGILTSDKLSKFEEKFRRWGTLFVLFGRHLLGLRAQIFLVAGVMKMPLKTFLVVDATSAMLTIALWGGVGYVGGSGLRTLTQNVRNFELILIVFLLILVSTGVLIQFLKHRRKQLGEERKHYVNTPSRS